MERMELETAQMDSAGKGSRPPIRLVAADLDGTLLTPQGAISERTLAAVRALEREGIALCLATARRWASTAPLATSLALRGPLILYDGAIVRDYPSGEVLSCDPLPWETAQAAVELLAAHGLRPIVQYSHYSAAEGELLLAGPASTGSDGPDASAHFLANFAAQVRVAPIAELADREGALRVVAFGSARRLRQVAREAAQLPCGRQILKTGSYGTAELTCFAATASKGAALVALAERLGVSPDETFAIGDGVNDISMLRLAGVSVAMRNAPQVVRRAARHQTQSNAEDGFVAALEAHVLGVVAR
jgi:Cof subfamily protein (haloacid dehalogenase superfamily)